MTYIEFINAYNGTGNQKHHIEPQSIQRKKNGSVADERVVYLSPAAHLYAHILYDMENGTKTRNFLWNFFKSRSFKDLNWKTCTLEDLEDFNRYYDQRNETISKISRNKSKEWKNNIRIGTQNGKQSLPKSNEWKEAISIAKKKQGKPPRYNWTLRNIETGETINTSSLRKSLKKEVGESGCILLSKNGVFREWIVLKKEIIAK